ncbi:MAG: hypothetical protein ABI882_07705 [Acidobacteriota bacterium]
MTHSQFAPQQCVTAIRTLLLVVIVSASALAQELARVSRVDRQPLAAQATMLVEALDYLGSPLSITDKRALDSALSSPNPAEAITGIQKVFDKLCLMEIHINPESRVRVEQGPALPELSEQGWRTFLVKIRNEAGVTAELKAESPNTLPVYLSAWDRRKSQPGVTISATDVMNRWLELSIYAKPPFSPRLSGLEVEYRVIQLYSRDTGKRAAKLGFNVGQGTQDIGFRNDVNILFTCKPSIDVTLRVMDENGKPTTASFVVRDRQGHIYPSPPKRMAPDFAFQEQIYRADGETIRLPAGEYEIEYSRGPEYLIARRKITVSTLSPQVLQFRLERWIDTAKMGWYSGDHHISCRWLCALRKPD